MIRSADANRSALREHTPAVFDGDLVIFSAAGKAGPRRWRRYVTGRIAAHTVGCTHHEMLTAGSLRLYGRQLKRALETA